MKGEFRIHVTTELYVIHYINIGIIYIQQETGIQRFISGMMVKKLRIQIPPIRTELQKWAKTLRRKPTLSAAKM